MSRTGSDSEIPERKRSWLNSRSLETSPPELGQPLAYLLHLRSCWKPEGRAKLVVPSSWMQFLTFVDATDACTGVRECHQRCPFRNVRFGSIAETRLVASDEELPQDIVSQLLSDFGIDDGGLETFVRLAFQGIHRTHLKSGVPTMDLHSSWRIDFVLVLEDGNNDILPEDTKCLLLGMKAPLHHANAAPSNSPCGGVPIRKELTAYVEFHLTHLASLIKQSAPGTEPFPEWFVLFGLIYDTDHVRIIAFLPCRGKLGVIGCAAYILDNFSLHTSVAGTSTCELALERLRFLMALTTLRRHVHHLSRSLFTIEPHDGIGRADDPSPFGFSACDQDNSDDSGSPDRRASLGSSQHCSSEYSTCPSSVPARELNDIPVFECDEDFPSSCKSFTSSFCSTCSSSVESSYISGSSYSDDSRHTEHSMVSLAQRGNKSATCPNRLMETKRWEIIAWAQEVVPTEHPVKDTYRMIPILGGQESQTANQLHADRHYQL